ncbi:MAG: ABC transporter permease, partial [bacterium]
RYFWGFLQIQDLLDNAIIELKTGHKSYDRVFMQQFPYPCFMRNNFLSGLYTAQIIPIALVFSSAVVVCIFVNEFIKERESGNMQIFKIRGLMHTVIWLSNFFTMALILVINSSLSAAVLYWGDLVPLSQPLIIWMVLLGYSFSLMMFIFLMTTLLTKSSSGSVTAFLVFILTLLPFLVMMAIEKEEVGTAANILTNLFMSTAFGSSILYITRYEQKQLGMNWDNFTVSPID